MAMDNFEVVLSNLYENEERLTALLEIRLSHISDLSALLTPFRLSSDPYNDAESDPLQTAFSSFREEIDRLRGQILSKLPAGSGKIFSERVLDGVAAESLARMAEMIVSKSNHYPPELTVQRIERAKIAYFPTALSELAGRAFGRELPMSTATPFDSFAAACEEVYSGRYDFCILPASGQDEGLLLPFLRLAERYELKSILSCDIRRGDEPESTFYLYGSRLIRGRNFDRMDVCLHLPSGKILPVLEGFHQLGIVCEYLTSLPYSIYGEDACLVRLFIGKVDPAVVLLFLTLAVPAFSLCGIYKRLTAVDRSEKS
ncbi:MAG: hypothetical protein ACI3XR_01650 [Eubacteriales bacterium]